MDQQDCLDVIAGGEYDAYDLLMRADPNLRSRFKRLDTAIVKLLEDVKKHFPDACFYTASRGFHFMLGASHSNDSNMIGQQLVAMSGRAQIGDGDF